MKGIIKTNTILDRFVEINQERIERDKKGLSFHARNLPKPVLFLTALQDKKSRGEIGMIAEIKKASPLQGVLMQNVSVEALARIYEKAGVDGISVLTQPCKFNGSFDDLKAVSDVVQVPTLCKEFIIDQYQLYQARLMGASAVLLIVALLEKSLLKDLIAVSRELSLDVLVEIHSRQELEKAMNVDALIIGINARNLKTMKIDLRTVEKLMPYIPKEKVRIAESGIRTLDDVKTVQKAGADAVLIGSVIMESKNLGEKIKELLQ